MLTRPSAFDKNLGQLRLLEPLDGTWVDAGCGTGAFTLPLATLVRRVIAVDRDANALSRLQAIAPDNVTCIQADIYKDPLVTEDQVQGVLFAFSLHYQRDRAVALRNATRVLTSNGRIVIFDYDFRAPRPWVPRTALTQKRDRPLRRSGPDKRSRLRQRSLLHPEHQLYEVVRIIHKPKYHTKS